MISVIEEGQEKIDGIVDNVDIAHGILPKIKKGSVIALCRESGWNLQFIEGDPGQVTVQETPRNDLPHRFIEDWRASTRERASVCWCGKSFSHPIHEVKS